MATYIPNATQATEPVASRTVESAALEFRTLKSSVNSRIDAANATAAAGLATETAARISADTAEATARIQADQIEQAARIIGDQTLRDMVSPYITQIANLGFVGNMDFGFITDSVIQSRFDLGSLI